MRFSKLLVSGLLLALLAMTCCAHGSAGEAEPVKRTQVPRRERGYDRDTFPKLEAGASEQQFAADNPDAELIGERLMGTHKITLYEYLYVAPSDRLRSEVYYFFADGAFFQWDHKGDWPSQAEVDRLPSK